MKVTFIFLISLIFCCDANKRIVIDCVYEENSSYGYTCKVQNTELITSKDNREITGVRGFHLDGKGNDDVKLLDNYPVNTKCFYFPRMITKFFKNIESVQLHKSALKKLSKDDLEQFGEKLKKLYMHQDNDIEVIEADLFEHNPNLEEIYLQDNKIRHIEDGTFDGLQKLKELRLHGNTCTSETDYTTDRSKLMAVIRSVERKCKDKWFIISKEKDERIKELEAENKKIKENCSSA